MYELYGEYYENVIGKRSYGITCGCVQELECINEHSGKINICRQRMPYYLSPKHKRKPSDDVYGSAGAWQFTINDSIQFSKLRIDGVYTYAEGEKARISKREWSEKLECEIYEEENQIFLEVINVIKKPKTNATKKYVNYCNKGFDRLLKKNLRHPNGIRRVHGPIFLK